MQKISKVTFILSGILVVGMLTGCGSKKVDPLLGRYDVYAIETGGMTVLASDVLEGESYLELKDKKKATLVMDGQESEIKWKADGDEIQLTDSEDSMDATVEDDIITLDFEGSKMYFAKGWADTESIKAISFNDFGLDDYDVEDFDDVEADADAGEDETDDADEADVESGDEVAAGTDEADENGLKKSATEPKGESGEFISEDDLKTMVNWLQHSKNMSNADYDMFVSLWGEATEDRGNNGSTYMSDYGDHCFKWKCSENMYVYIAFRTKDGEVWRMSSYQTNGFTFEDCKDYDYSGLPEI